MAYGPKKFATQAELAEKIGEGWELIEKKELTATTINIDFDNLDGDKDVVYRMIGIIKAGTADNTDFVLKPNKESAAVKALWSGATWDGTTAANEAHHHSITSGFWLVDIPAGLQGMFDFILHAKTGLRRMFTGKTMCERVAADIKEAWGLYAGVWDNTNTKITSLRVQDLMGVGAEAGSIFLLFRLKT